MNCNSKEYGILYYCIQKCDQNFLVHVMSRAMYTSLNWIVGQFVVAVMRHEVRIVTIIGFSR